MKLRAAMVGDELAVATIHVRAWQAGYRGLLPPAYLDGLRAEQRASRYTFANADGPQTTVAIDAKGIVGFATVSRSELSALYVDPAAWRCGVGTLLLAEARASMLRAGETRAHLWLLNGNVQGLAFYVRDGWLQTGAERSEELWGVHVKEIGLERPLQPTS